MHRQDIGYLLRAHLPCDAVGVEVGVELGEFSRILLRTGCFRKLFLIDIWKEQEDYIDSVNVSQSIQDLRFKIVSEYFHMNHRDCVNVLRTTSEQAANLLVLNDLDFVYIDARHDYASVVRDLYRWSRNLKIGGLLSGHDYLDGVFGAGKEETVIEVKSAVDDFLRLYGLTATEFDPRWPSWYVVWEPIFCEVS